MKFTVEQSVLKTTIPALARIAKRAGRRLTALEYVLFVAAGEAVIATTSDIETAVQFTLQAQVDIKGSALVNAEKLAQIVSAIKPGPVVFDTDPESWRTKISADATDYSLAGLDPSEYPEISMECDEWVTMEAATLTAAIDAVAFAASEDENRFNLSGMYLEPQEHGVVCVATDGHRLAKMSTTMNLGPAPILVPSKGIAEVRKVLDGNGGEIQVGFANKMLLVGTENSRMSVRCLDGDYPDYNKVIPPSCKQSVTFARSELIAAIKRVVMLNTDRNKSVSISARPENIKLEVTHPDLGTAKDVIGAAADGEGWDAHVNVYYLQDALDAFEAEQIRMEWAGNGAAILLRAADGGQYLNLIMPMRK